MENIEEKKSELNKNKSSSRLLRDKLVYSEENSEKKEENLEKEINDSQIKEINNIKNEIGENSKLINFNILKENDENYIKESIKEEINTKTKEKFKESFNQEDENNLDKKIDTISDNKSKSEEKEEKINEEQNNDVGNNNATSNSNFLDNKDI